MGTGRQRSLCTIGSAFRAHPRANGLGVSSTAGRSNEKPKRSVFKRRIGPTYKVPFFLSPILFAGFMALYGHRVSNASEQPKNRIFVYIQTEMTPRAFERELSKALPQFSVKVFGRLGDFRTAIEKENPEVVIARRPVLLHLGLEPVIQGTRGGLDTESFVLLSVDAVVDVSTVPTKIVGVVDLLGRKGMTDFVSRLLNAKPAKIKRTSKVQDLLGLLQIGAADAVLIAERNVEKLKRDSRLDLKVTSLENSAVGLPAVAVSSAASKESIAASIQNISPDLAGKMGVDQWN